MADRRWKNRQWNVTTADGRSYENANIAQLLAVLMDIRDEMQKLNRVFECQNFTAIPRKLDRIALNTAKPKRKKPR